MYERHNKTRDINNNSLKARTRSSNDLHCDEITNPTMMFTNQMIFEDIPQQTTEAEEIMAQDVFRLEIDGTQLEDWDALMEEVIIDDLPPPLHFKEPRMEFKSNTICPSTHQYQMIGTMGQQRP